MKLTRESIRTIAVKILLENAATGRNASDLLEKHFSAVDYPDNDRHLLSRIVLGILRNTTLIDHIIHLYAKKTRKTPLNILRTAAYQALFMDKIPSYAVISEAMMTADSMKLSLYEKKFIRGVMASLSREAEKLEPGGSYASSLPLSVRFSHPQWIIEEWSSIMTEAELLECLKAGNSNPPVWIYPPDGNAAVLKELLVKNMAEHEEIPDTPGFAVHKSGKMIKDWLTGGLVYAQSPFQYQAVSRCPASGGDIVLEIGAAPGGKTVMLSRKTHPGGLVYSMDKNPDGMKKLVHRTQLLRLSNVIPVLGDFLDDRGAEIPGHFNHIVLDAPCSNLAELCRRPEARWRITRDDTGILSALQIKLAGKCWEKLLVNGTLLYITCTLSRQENQAVRDFIREKLNGRLMEERMFLPSVRTPAGGYYCLFMKQ